MYEIFDPLTAVTVYRTRFLFIARLLTCRISWKLFRFLDYTEEK